MRRLTIAIAAGALAVLGGTALYAQEKYALVSPGGRHNGKQTHG